MGILDGRRAFITGSTRGIGLEIAKSVSRAGAKVLLHGSRHASTAQDAAAACAFQGSPAPVIAGDLTGPMPEGVIKVADAAIAAEPNIDTLVCNAGTFIDQPFLEMDFETFDRTMKLNVYSQFVIIQHFARRWVQNKVSGRILLIGSINGRLSETVHVAYDSSKGAIDAMVRSLCVALAPLGIRVNGLAPGLVRTPLTAPAIDDPRFRRWMELHTPNGKVPDADVCGDVAAFLLSDAAEHIHGQMLLVDGGMSAWQQPDPPDDWMPVSTSRGSA